MFNKLKIQVFTRVLVHARSKIMLRNSLTFVQLKLSRV